MGIKCYIWFLVWTSCLFVDMLHASSNKMKHEINFMERSDLQWKLVIIIHKCARVKGSDLLEFVTMILKHNNFVMCFFFYFEWFAFCVFYDRVFFMSINQRKNHFRKNSYLAHQMIMRFLFRSMVYETLVNFRNKEKNTQIET